MNTKTPIAVPLIFFLLTACSGGNAMIPTPSPAPTESPQPTPTTESPAAGDPVLVTIVPPGKTATFRMGSTDEELEAQSGLRKDAGYYTDDEQPAHEVVLSVPYGIGKYEVTNAQYCDVMNWAIERGWARVNGTRLVDSTGTFTFLNLDPKTGGYKSQLGIRTEDGRLAPAEKRADHPVNAVTWYGAAAFANYLSRRDGWEPVYDESDWTVDAGKNGYRLPTEAEWEYAARGSKRYVYAWGDTISDAYNLYGDTHPVGYFDGTEKKGRPTGSNASPFGAFDMTGNVWEWCADWYGRAYYRQSPEENPPGPETGDERPPYDAGRPTKVWRGGGMLAPEDWGYLRIAKRWSSAPDQFYMETGFRLARTLTPHPSPD